jgi:hypothetical protein
MKRRLLAAIVAASLSIPILAQAAGDADVSDAKLTLSGGSIAAGIGFSWGSGTLEFQGKNYKVKISGLSVADVGVSSVAATGDVYHLKNLSDFNGTYAAAGAGATLVGGGSIVTMQNGQGVVIHLRSQQSGLRLTLAASGITMSVVP